MTRNRQHGADLSSVRRHNLGLLMSRLRAHSSQSRAALSSDTGLTKVAVSSLVAELLERGLLEEQQLRATGRAGRPGRPLALRAAGAAGLGLWIDVDRVGACVTDLQGVARVAVVRPRDNRSCRPATALAHAARLARRVLDEAGSLGLKPCGTAVAVPGLVDTARGLLYVAPNLGWSDLSLARSMAQALGRAAGPVQLSNEANAAALAERAMDPERPDNFLFVTLGVGVGAGVILGGTPFLGARGFGGELGHTTIVPGGPRCGCGNRGCLEALVGRDALLRLSRKRLRGCLPTGLTADETLAALGRLADEGHGGAREVLAQTGDWLAQGLSSFANLFDPEVIVLGGYGPLLFRWLGPPIEKQLRRTVLSARWAPSELRAARSGVDAPLLGAGLLALEHAFEDPTRLGAVA